MAAVRGAVLMLSLLTGLGSLAVRGEDAEGPEKALLGSVLRVDPVPHMRRLSSVGSRVTGYPGCQEAADYIEAVFRRIGLADVRHEPFQVVVPYDHGAELKVGGKAIKLACCWPNAARTSQTPPAGITGPLIWGGEGYFSDMDGKPVTGSVVLMEFNTATRWLNAAQLGARAVIFLEPEAPFRSEAEQKFLDLPLAFPRYYLTWKEALALAQAAAGADAAAVRTPEQARAVLARLAGTVEVNLRARMVWEEKTVYRIVGTVPGINPEYRDRVYLYHSYYDAISAAPAVAPGAESTLGVAALIESARVLVEHPPAVTVRFMAIPGHFEALAGMREYAGDRIFPRRVLPTEEERRAGEPAFAVGLDLSTRSDALAAFYKGHFYDQYGAGNEIRLQRIFSGFGDAMLGWAGELAVVQPEGARARMLSGIVPREGVAWSALLPGEWAFDAEVLSMCGRPSLTLATCGDDRSALVTPLDTFERLSDEQLRNARAQAQAAAWLLARTARADDLGLKGRIDLNQVADMLGKSIEQSVVSYLPTVAVSDSIVSVEIAKAKTLTGVLGKVCVRSDDRGLFRIFGLPNNKGVWVTGFGLDSRTGAISRIGLPKWVWVSAQARKRAGEETVSDVRLPFISCVATAVYDLVDPLSFRPLNTLQVYDGASNSLMRADEMVVFQGRQSATTSYGEPVAVVFTQPERRLKITAAVSQVGNDGVLLNSEDSEQGFNGTGYDTPAPENEITRTSYRMARDMFLLDKYRIRILEKTGIKKQNVQRLHDAAGYELKAAETAFEKRRYDESYRHSRRAWALEKRVYPDVQDTANDAVRGIIFYFAILLPFVIFAERLLVNFADIRAKLTAIGVIFVISYLVLMFVHPAFQLSKTPVIILIGFFMSAVGLCIIALLVMRFQQLTEQLRQRIATIHRADVARASAAMAAFILGISNMRKRKVRTLLTSVTLILLTFTILSFTSFESLPATLVRYRSKQAAPYDGVLIRRLSWDPVQEFVFYDIRNFFVTQGFRPALRSWFVSTDPTKELQIEVTRTDGRGDASFVASALLGMAPEEKEVTGIDQMVRGGRWPWLDETIPGYPFVCILPARMAEVLGIDPSELDRTSVSVMGKQLKVIGILDGDRFAQFRDLDREVLTPVDFVEQQFKQQQGGSATLTASGEVESFAPETEESNAELYVHMEPDRVVIVPNELAISLGASLRSVAVAAGSHEGVMTLVSFYDVLRQYAERVSLALYAGVDGQLYRIATRSKLSMGGIKALIVPIIIAALIVFNTMLGAVFERRREITIYASVGLAPVHISALFFAESCVFAVIGAMVGYIMGQTISRLLVNVPWLMEGMSLNYSSMSAVWSAFLVVGVVLASTIYPARLAASLSVPDETRKMAVEKPTGDEWNIVFPFTVSSLESLGVMNFLREYVQSHDEDSIGAFSAADVRFERVADGGHDAYALSARVWVAPLDMGISQRIRILARPDAEEPLITYLYFTITRLSGEFETWHRMNMGFLKDLRKQLLIWRLVTTEEKKRLQAEGRELLAGKPAIEIAPERPPGEDETGGETAGADA